MGIRGGASRRAYERGHEPDGAEADPPPLTVWLLPELELAAAPGSRRGASSVNVPRQAQRFAGHLGEGCEAQLVPPRSANVV